MTQPLPHRIRPTKFSRGIPLFPAATPMGPVGGCGGDLGCFRVLQFGDEPDGKRSVRGGDGWVLAVEFGPVPRAYSVLGYGNSNLPDSPYNGDQGELFARGELKRVAFTAADIDATAEKRYRPGSSP